MLVGNVGDRPPPHPQGLYWAFPPGPPALNEASSPRAFAKNRSLAHVSYTVYEKS
jgi:hypothetical protein